MSSNLKTVKVKRFDLPIEVGELGGYFVASCPIWTDCYAQGKTIDEATSEIVSVASSLIELYEEEGINIPLKTASNYYPISFNVPVFSTA